MSMPNDALSTTPRPAALLAPDSAARPVFTVDYELGGVALSDPSEGLRAYTWRVRLEGTAVKVGRSPYSSETTLFTGEGITELSLAFDQNMRPAVAYVQADQAKLYWYDSVLEMQVTTTLAAGVRCPFLTMDDKRDFASAIGSNDILLIYMRGAGLFQRRQRDRFDTEIPLKDPVPGGGALRIAHCGMHQGLRLQVDFERGA